MEFSSISQSLNKKIFKVEKRSENTAAEVRELKIETAKNKKIMDRIERDQKRYNVIKRFLLSLAPDFTSSDLLARSRFIPILETARTEGHLHTKLRGVRLFMGDRIFAYDSELSKVKEIDREQRKVVAV